MLKFYDVDPKYTDYLRKFDRQVPHISYSSRDKFLCGIVFQFETISYYAPVSSFTTVQRTNLPIYNSKNEIKGTIRFCFMFPAPMSVLKEKDFSLENSKDSKYAGLLKIEYDYCTKNEPLILAKAKSIYKIGCDKQHPFNYTCCDFKVLERAYSEFIK